MSNLLVQNIKHTNATTAISVDSSGRVTTPVKPAFHAVRTSNYRFTAPVSGLYYFTCSWVPYTTSNGEGNYFRKNGSQIGQKTYVINADQQVTNSHIFELASSDYVDVYFIANGCEYVYSHFSGYLIG